MTTRLPNIRGTAHSPAVTDTELRANAVDAPPEHRLSIVIPAYNEEESIASIIERTLAARATLCRRAGLASVEVIVVSDGSSDRTAEIASGYPEIRLIAYEKNRGYGAAIKLGFEHATGDLLGFLDADGTCDPLFFAELCTDLRDQRADVALGSRLGPDSEMPKVRRLGNRLFATLINLWGGTHITDSASGMRVLRRSSLAKLYPLPDGLHFTPAMSTLAIFDPQLTIVERPMRYRERVGASKLRVIKDGLRFLRTIVDTALTFRPLRFFGSVGAVLLLVALGYAVKPVVEYVTAGRVEEWMIYRLVAVAVGLTCGALFLGVGAMGQQAVSVIHRDFSPPSAARRFINQSLLAWMLPLGAISALIGVAINASSLMEYARTGHITAHWIYVLTGGLLVTLGAVFVGLGVLARVLNILTVRLQDRPTL